MTTAAATLDRTKLLAARIRAAHDRPYLASALFTLVVVPSTLLDTMAVDRFWRCYVNPSFVEATSVPELAGVWIHEVSHLLRDHHGRATRLPAKYRDQRLLVNVAQDCEINDDLVADGITLPANRIVPATFDLPAGRLFEQYLPDIPIREIHLQCGSGAHGGDEKWDLGAGGAPSLSPVEAEAIRRITADAIRNHIRSRGTMPAGWRRWADEVLEPTVDWRQVLAGSVRRAVAAAAGAVDYTYRRPSRRAASQPRVVLPSLRRPLPTVVIVVDTSGSMSDDDLREAMGEIAGVLRTVGVRGITVLAVDAAVHVAQRVSKASDLEFAGGGGTDMRVGIEAALGSRPDVIVVLTDGATPWPEAPVPARVIAGLIGTNPPMPPPWIEAVQIG